MNITQEKELASASSPSLPKDSPAPKKRGRKKKKKNYYFTEETEAELVNYLNCDCQETKNAIFTKHLYYPFYKMSENLIHTFKFYYTEVETLEDLKHEMVIFFLEKLDKFKVGRGKAFSYFSIAGKRYLINYNTKNYKKLIKKADVEAMDTDYYLLKEGDVITNRDVTIAFFSYFVDYLDENLFTLFTKPKEQKVASAFIIVFKSRKNPGMLFNKKALWVYIREITNLEEKETPIITRVVKKMKKIYVDQFASYSQQGYL